MRHRKCHSVGKKPENSETSVFGERNRLGPERRGRESPESDTHDRKPKELDEHDKAGSSLGRGDIGNREAGVQRNGEWKEGMSDKGARSNCYPFHIFFSCFKEQAAWGGQRLNKEKKKKGWGSMLPRGRKGRMLKKRRDVPGEFRPRGGKLEKNKTCRRCPRRGGSKRSEGGVELAPLKKFANSKRKGR